jgi:hypothetical protein
MSAWIVKNRWDDSYAARFRYWVPTGVHRHKSKSRFTCEDLAVQLIIDFAVAEQLSLRIRNGSRTTGYVPSDFDSLADYRIAVLKTTGARDLLRDDNTVAVGSGTAGRDSDLAFAKAGDMIVMNDGDYRHVQVVTHARATTVEIAQGNFRDATIQCSGGKNENNPVDKCYLGVPVQQARYELRGGSWRYTRGRDELVYQNEQARVRRWKILAFNPPQVDAWMQMTGPWSEGRPGRRW